MKPFPKKMRCNIKHRPFHVYFESEGVGTQLDFDSFYSDKQPPFKLYSSWNMKCFDDVDNDVIPEEYYIRLIELLNRLEII